MTPEQAFAEAMKYENRCESVPVLRRAPEDAGGARDEWHLRRHWV